jgi:hypothetical protein
MTLETDGDTLERGHISPEDALADAQAQLTEAQAQAQADRAAREEAERRAAQAGNQAQGATEAALSASIAAEEQRLANARLAYRQARETGDMDAELTANEDIASARQAVDRMKADKARIATQRQQPAAQPQAGMSPESQRWIATHPRFNSDPVYNGTATGAHFDAIRLGMIEASPAYFAHINQVLERTYGENHGSLEAMSGPKQPAAPARQGARPPASSFAAPSSRGNSQTRSDSADPNRIAALISAMGDSQVTADDIRAHAAACKMTVEAYCKSQAEILAEQKAGRTGGVGRDYKLS